MSEEPFATGQCQCGSVRYTILAAPVRMGQCHCDDCRKSTGTGHSSNAFFNKKNVHIDGQTSRYESETDTGSILTRFFCPNCGSRLFGTSSMLKKIMSVSAGTLDDSSWFKPDAIVYKKRQPVWDLMDESIPSFEEMAPIPTRK